MEDAYKIARQNEPKSNRFLGCFGLPNQPDSEENYGPYKMVNTTNNNEIKKDKKLKWFSWLSSHRKSSRELHSAKLYGKARGEDRAPVINSKVEKEEQVGDDDIIYNSGNKKLPRRIKDKSEFTSGQKLMESPHDLTLVLWEDGKEPDNVDAQKDDTGKKQQSFCLKIDAIGRGDSQSGSHKTKTKRRRATPRTTSLTVQSQEKQINELAAPNCIIIAAKSRNENHATNNEYDPTVGMSIVLVTLLIMLVWGRLCAILCTCSWLYFVPRFRAMANQNRTLKIGSIRVKDVNSKDYEKRVVLDGLLERSHRTLV